LVRAGHANERAKHGNILEGGYYIALGSAFLVSLSVVADTIATMVLPCSSLLSFAAAITFGLVGVVGVPPTANSPNPRASAVPFFSPLDGGGSELDIVSPGLGEPMNVIISGLSDPRVLTDDGFLNWAQSVEMSTECLDVHLGAPQMANLGDGNGAVNQTVELRQDYGNDEVGTCLESLIGGNHLRMYRQNGTLADSGALFLAVSKEEDLEESHTIVPNGYDIGRDLLVAAAVNNGGTTSHDGLTYKASSQNITGLLTPGSNGVNHDIAIDGMVVLLTVEVVS